MDTSPIHIIELKRQLANAINSIENLAKSSNDQLQAQHENTESTLTTLESTLQAVQNPNYLKRIISKQHKLERKKQGKKRRAENAEKRRIQLEKRREKLHADIDRWQRETRQQEEQRKQQHEQRKSHQPSSSQKSRIRELSKLVEKLIHLRSIRRKRLEAKGHFFLEEGNEFFEKVKSWNAEQEDQAFFQEKEHSAPEEEKALYIHPDDNWSNKDLFDKKAYEYWSQGFQDTDSLRRIRNQWDCYIVDNNSNSSRQDNIPPTWVPPAPPSNWIWATYLVNQSP